MKPVIICVDDEEDVLRSLKSEIKESFGKHYSIELAANGNDALNLLEELLNEKEEVALVISDYIMPEMKGDELLVNVHKKLPFAKKIMISGQANTEGIEMARTDGGLHCFIEKPWSPDRLMAVLREALEEYKRAQ